MGATTEILKLCMVLLAFFFVLALVATYYFTIPVVKVEAGSIPEYMDVKLTAKRTNDVIHENISWFDDYELGFNLTPKKIDMGCHYAEIEVKLKEPRKGYWFIFVDGVHATKLKNTTVFSNERTVIQVVLTCQEAWHVFNQSFTIDIVEVNECQYWIWKHGCE